MTYDFDTVISRKKTDSLKWDVKDNELPMWVADMDFKTAPEIIKDLEVRVSIYVQSLAKSYDDGRAGSCCGGKLCHCHEKRCRGVLKNVVSDFSLRCREFLFYLFN